MELFHYPDDRSDERELLDLERVRPAGCLLCGDEVDQVVVMFPTSDDLKRAVMTLRSHPVPATTSHTGFVCGICAKHARDMARTFEALEQKVLEMAGEVKWQ